LALCSDLSHEAQLSGRGVALIFSADGWTFSPPSGVIPPKKLKLLLSDVTHSGYPVGRSLTVFDGNLSSST